MLTRFAPAPTGWLHLGHVVNALYVWGFGAAHGAEVLLRIEDHDGQRSRPEYERGILDDLDWLGFMPQRYPTSLFRAGSCASRQRDRQGIYLSAARRLIADGAVYGCACSRQDYMARPQADAGTGPRSCPGECAARGVEATEGIAWRLRVPSGVELFDDMIAGPQTIDAAALGDVVIRDRLGNWTYQFAVTVDDLEQGVDMVIRGQDLLRSTGLQIQLGRRLGRLQRARFAHHRLIMKSGDQKLSKSDGDMGVRDLARTGWTGPEVIGRAAQLAGLAPESRPLRATEAVQLFG